jgi:hypothetical protein
MRQTPVELFGFAKSLDVGRTPDTVLGVASFNSITGFASSSIVGASGSTQPLEGGEALTSQAEQENAARVRLLAKSYVQKSSSPELKARLAILTERVEQLVSRMDVTDVEGLTAMVDRASHADTQHAAIFESLGLVRPSK